MLSICWCKPKGCADLIIVNEPLVSFVHVMPIACKIWTAIALIFHTDVAEVAFNRCITTNETKEFSENVIRENEVHATSDNFKVDFNYEFLEDFQDKQTGEGTRQVQGRKVWLLGFHHQV